MHLLELDMIYETFSSFHICPRINVFRTFSYIFEEFFEGWTIGDGVSSYGDWYGNAVRPKLLETTCHIAFPVSG
jgi:hypothetical protein